MELDKIAKRVTKRYKSTDPFQLCDRLGIVVMFMQMKDIRGLYMRLKGRDFIYIDEMLEDYEQRFVCAHELSHYLLHRDLNRMFMDARTFLKTSIYERDADRLAAWILYPNDDALAELAEFTFEQASGCMGIPLDVAQYRMEGIKYPFNLSMYRQC